MPALLLLTGPSSGLRYEIQNEVVLGRSSHCEVPLEDGKVSRRHARVELKNGQVLLSDLGSRNGTLLNGERISKESVLRPGDRFQVGDTTVLFEPSAREATLDEATQADLDAAPIDELLPSQGPAGFLVGLAKGALSGLSGPAVMRRGAEQVLARVNAEWAVVLMQQPEGLSQVCMVGTGSPVVPKPMATRAISKNEAVWDGGGLCVPLGAGPTSVGVLFVDREAAFTSEERQLVAAAARVMGEAWMHFQQGAPVARALVGSADAFKVVLDGVRKVAAAKDSVVLVGEPGSGKRTLAEHLHQKSARALGPLVVVDCRDATHAVEDALFGRAASASSAAVVSALARADGGTLILHHVEGLLRTTSERLARHLTRRTAPGVAGEEVKVDVRVVATAGMSLSALTGGGHQALATALAPTEVKVPSLRDRAVDIPELFLHFTHAIAARNKQTPATLGGETARMLSAYPWPKNVEEVRLVAERMAALYPGDELPTYWMPSEMQKVVAGQETPTLQAMIERLEKDVISEALRQAKGKKIKAAAMLDISRPTLDKKIEDYALKVEKVRDE
jgi:DNA-binding NtrC family response regulator